MDNKKEKIIIETIDKNGKKLVLAIKIPGYKILQDAQMIYNIELTSLIKRSVAENIQLLSRQQLDQYLNDLGIWTEKEIRQFLQLQLELRSLELKLKAGGIKISEAKNIALTMKTKRAALLVLYSRRSQFDEITIESMADNKKFKFLITKCIVVDETDMPFFASIEDYETKQNEKSAIDAATALAGYLYGYNKQTEANLVENKWLQQFNFADEHGRLIDNCGRLIDIDGRLINNDGRFIDEQGKFVDNQGRPIDENGDFIIDAIKPFLDDDGKPIFIRKKVKTKKKNIKYKD